MATINGYENELELSDYVKILRRRWPWILLPLLLIMAAAAAYTLSQTLTYRARASVLLADSAAQDAYFGAGNVNAENRDLANEINIALSDVVRDEVERRSGGPVNVTIERSFESDLLLFNAAASTPTAAADAANTWANVYVEAKQEQAASSLATTITAFEEDIVDLRTQRQELRLPLDRLEDDLAAARAEDDRARLQTQVDRLKADLQVELSLIDNELRGLGTNVTNLQIASQLARTGTAQVTQEAFPPQNPSNAPLSRNLILGGVVGLILGVGLALMIDNLDRSIKSSQDLAGLGLPVLGLIPKPGRDLPISQLPLATMNHTGTSVADGYQKVRTAVEFALLGRKIKSLLITSANPSEGKTSTSCNLSWAMSAVDHRVVLADVDFRRPRIHDVFACAPEPGLSDNLLHGTPLNQLALRVDDERSNMVIIPTGARPPSPGDFVASPAFSDLLRNLEAEADLVILDAPPVLPVSDALSIARHVDAVLVVAKAGETSKQDLSTAVEGLRRVGADVLGVCLIGAKPETTSYGYEAIPAPRKSRRSRTTLADIEIDDDPLYDGDWNPVDDIPVGREPQRF